MYAVKTMTRDRCLRRGVYARDRALVVQDPGGMVSAGREEPPGRRQGGDTYVRRGGIQQGHELTIKSGAC